MLTLIKRIYALLIEAVNVVYGVFPTSADGVAAAAVQLASAAVAWTWGAWTQVVLLAGVTVDTWIYGVTLENFVGAATQGEVAIGFGTAPLGTEQIRVPIVSAFYPISPPVLVKAGNGIVARYRTATGVADNVSVKVLTRTGA